MEFHADVPIANFKIFSAVLDLFSNLSELVSIDIRNNQFILSAINLSRTAQGLVRISPLFFQDFKLLRNGTNGTAMCCTVSNKNFNSMFKKNIGNIDSIETIKISITQGSVDREQHTEARIQLKLIYKNRVSKKSSMFYTNGDPIEALYPSDNMHNFVMSPLVLKGCLTKFHPKVTDIIFQCTPHTICVKSYWDEHTTSSERPVQSSYTVSSNDCFVYSVIEPVKVICNLKEFRAYIDFIDYIEDNVTASFESVGKPILFTYRLERLIMLDLALMTQGDANEDPNGGDMSMDDFTIDSISTSEIFNTRAPPHSSRNRNQHRSSPSRQPQQQQSHQTQQRHTASSSSAGNSATRSQRSFHSRTTVAASTTHLTDALSAPSNDSGTPLPSVSSGNRNTTAIHVNSSGNESDVTIPVNSSSGNGSFDAGSHKSNESNSSVHETDDSEEPLFRKNPLSRRAVERETADADKNNNRPTSSNSRGSSKVAPTGQRLTTLQQLRLKHQMRNAAASSSTSPAPVERRENNKPTFENDEERDNLLSRIKYENDETMEDDQPRKRRHLVHRD